MNALIAAYGRLVADPREHETKTGASMATARLAVTVDARGGEESEATLWLDIVTFGRAGEALTGHAKGETVSVAGRLQMSHYTSQEGEARETWTVVPDSVVSARTVRPGGARRKDSAKPKDAGAMAPGMRASSSSVWRTSTDRTCGRTSFRT